MKEIKYVLVGYDENEKPLAAETIISAPSGIEGKRWLEPRAKDWREKHLYPLIRIIKTDEDTGDTISYDEWWFNESGWHHQYCEIHDVDE